MSISTEILRIQGNVADAYTAANAKGATMPVTQNSDNLASTISTIQTGTTPTGTIQITTNGTHDVTNYATADIQVPTTAPAHYIEKAVDANGKLIGGSTIMSFSGVTDVADYQLYYMYRNNTTISGAVDMSDLIQITGQSSCQTTFAGCTGITSVDLSSLTTINALTNAAASMFQGCTGITSVDLSSLTTISGQYACRYMFQNCTSLTSVDLSSLTTASGQYACYQMFQNCTSLTSVDLSGLQVSGSGTAACGSMFNGCTSLINLKLGFIKITTESYLGSMFQGCTSLTSVDLSSLLHIARTCCASMFSGCSNLATVDLSRLCMIGAYSGATPSAELQQAFANTALTELRFNNLAYCSGANLNNAFGNMLQGVTGCTVHFPSDWATDMASWSNVTNGFGGTNTTVLWDLPSVTTLDLTSIVDLGFYLGDNSAFITNSYINVTKIDLSGLVSIKSNGGLYNSFSGNTGITSVDLSNLAVINNATALNYTFRNCTGLTSLSFPSLKTVVGSGIFNNMLQGVTGATVHFPSNLSSYNFNCGGTNTTVLYDLPATA